MKNFGYSVIAALLLSIIYCLGQGLVVSPSGTSATVTRSMVGSGHLSASDGDGVSSNPTMTMSDVLSLVAGWYTNGAFYVDQKGIVTGAVNMVATDLPLAGGTVSGAVLSTATSASNSPAGNELPTAGWVRGLFGGFGVTYYVSTNETLFTNTDAATIVYAFQTATQYYALRTYVDPANGTYFGSVSTTNKFLQINSGITINSYLEATGGGGSAGPQVKPEIYLSYDGTNWDIGDWDAQPQYIPEGATNLYTWVVANPAYTSTNAAGFYVERRFKMVTQTAPASTVNFHLGGNRPSHMDLSAEDTSSGNAYLAANQTFTGSNNFQGGATVNGARVITNILGSGIITVTSNNLGEFTVAASSAAGPAIVTNSIWVPAGAMTPKLTTTPLASSFSNATTIIDTLDYDDSATEDAWFTYQPGKGYAGDVTICAYYITTNALNGASNILWQAAVGKLEAETLPGTLTWTTNILHHFLSSNSLQVAKFPLMSVPAGTADTLLNVRISRVGGDGTDTTAGDAKLTGVRLFTTHTNWLGGYP